jgi:hypothetical protein
MQQYAMHTVYAKMETKATADASEELQATKLKKFKWCRSAGKGA